MNTNLSSKKAQVDAGGDILRTDTAMRRKVHRLIAAMIVAVLLLWWVGLPALNRWMSVSDDSVFIQRMSTICYALGVMLFGTAGYAGWYARRIVGSSQFPPPGTWVMRDTRILRGDHARARAWWVLACAVSFVMLGVFTVFVMPGYFDGLLKARGARPVQLQPLQMQHPLPAQPAPPIAKPHG